MKKIIFGIFGLIISTTSFAEERRLAIGDSTTVNGIQISCGENSVKLPNCVVSRTNDVLIDDRRVDGFGSKAGAIEYANKLVGQGLCGKVVIN